MTVMNGVNVAHDISADRLPYAVPETVSWLAALVLACIARRRSKPVNEENTDGD